MSAVTEAVLRAEGAFKDALFFYDVLVKAEQAIVDSPDTTEFDKEIARRGVENATRILKGLQVLQNPPDEKRAGVLSLLEKLVEHAVQEFSRAEDTGTNVKESKEALIAATCIWVSAKQAIKKFPNGFPEPEGLLFQTAFEAWLRDPNDHEALMQANEFFERFEKPGSGA